MLIRPRRNRKSPAIRALLQENRLHRDHLIAPLFVLEGKNLKEPIFSMPEIYRLSLDYILEEVKQLYELGIKTVALFPVIPKEKKDPYGKESLVKDNLLARALKEIKNGFPDITLIADIALDPYTNHGHDGILNKKGDVDNDQTVLTLEQLSLHAAAAGADIVAPSDMMDGRIGAIRKTLDSCSFQETSILSYSAKYASAFYGPFREALSSSPLSGDKKSYQMHPANSREALLEAHLDAQEGADMLMVKPALPYLDIISKIKESVHIPVGAYHVSGEYSMVMAAAERGWLNADQVFLESLTSIKRAGAQFIFTYAAKKIATLL
jgi:porphobilinogen synthase